MNPWGYDEMEIDYGGERMTRRGIQPCRCRMSTEFGYDIQRWVGGDRSWTPIGSPVPFVQIGLVIEDEPVVLIRCGGCGSEVLREYEQSGEVE